MRMWRSASILAGCLLLGCGGSSRGPDEVSGLESRKALPEVRPPRHAGPVQGQSSAGDAPVAPAFPRTVSLDAFAEGDRISDLTALATSEQQVLLAWVTYVGPSGALPVARARGKKGSRAASSGSSTAPLGASVMVRPLDAKLEPLAGAKTISLKADAAGGVAIASSAKADEVGLAWVGKDGGRGQVFLTRLTPSGDKQAQKMLTHAKGDCSDVALAKLGDGWVVAWVEQEASSATLYVARVGRDLVRLGSEQKIVQAKGEVSQLRLLAYGDDVLVAWNETRPDDGGVYAARLTQNALTLRHDPARIAVTPGRAPGLRIARLGEGAVFAWLEERESAAATAGPRERAVVFARLDPAMKSSLEPIRVPIDLEASSLALTCGDRDCRVLVPGGERGELALYGFIYDGVRATKPARLNGIAGVSTEDISPVLVGDWLLFAEDNLHGRGRVRKAEIAWR